jgi:hypothetical protein
MAGELCPHPAFGKTPAGKMAATASNALKIQMLYRSREHRDYRWALAAAGACGSLSIQPIFSTFSSGPINFLFIS